MRWINLAVLPLLLAACTQTQPSIVNDRPMRSVVETQEIALHNDHDLRAVADLWKRGGQSRVELVATYKPGQEGAANYNASVARDRLLQMGVKDVTVTTMPAGSNQVIANMRTLMVGADSSCTQLPTSGASVNGYEFGSYRLGCTGDALLGKQVAHTADLEGRVPGQSYDTTSDGARQGAIVDGYRTGAPNERLEGLSSSDIAERDK